ncbi:pantoate--beta-alanine ligase [Ferruginibacter sp. HRS2-29]|uniref:pantoate--beta-alanine ligase n=1 Tax=Ferruginibacter sp. HRS2-29 TaxID=2487334 RepID=UPI0020CDBA36|nr:pantoate--beta-alanine ligase [Ferruginibacter sp. HRS2-29]MCP9750898.1 pantoate--beta-alanine ligase [Ferruginibacter sp. HRS2-29]
MILIKTIPQLQEQLARFRGKRSSIGFVPTMGALHQGHISLINKCKETNAVCVCSIFVNPTQFNNPADFEKYPITIEKDIDLLEAADCDILFLPAVAEMYPPDDVKEHYNLGYLETILEGKYRPGHFQGVCQIVDKLLAAVTPDHLFLGQKDYQQCMVITKMIELKGHKTTPIICPTIREKDGLAMSSRNLRLNEQERITALAISKALFYIKENACTGSLEAIRQHAEQLLTNAGYKVDYVAIADAATLQPVENRDAKQQMVALVAAFLNEVRLIDNMVVNSEWSIVNSETFAPSKEMAS